MRCSGLELGLVTLVLVVVLGLEDQLLGLDFRLATVVLGRVFGLVIGGVEGRSDTVGAEVPWMLLLGFYLPEAFQNQTNTEKILYNISR